MEGVRKMREGSNITIYHGSSQKVEIPDLGKSKAMVDFGVGFYTTEDIVLAKKWACKTEKSVINTYNLNIEGLKVKRLTLDAEWLDIVHSFRSGDTYQFDD